MIITDAEKLGFRADEIDTRKQGKECRQIISALKTEIKESNINSISAPQLGFPYRIFCIKFSNSDIRTFVNPIITGAGALQLSRETCNSIPGKTFVRPRNATVTVMYQTPLGKITTAKLIGAAALKVQHAIDHLDGLLLSDVGLEIDSDFDNAPKEEQEEVLKAYVESLDIKMKQLQGEIEEDPELKKINDGIKFMEEVAKGDTKVQVKKIPTKDLVKDK